MLHVVIPMLLSVLLTALYCPPEEEGQTLSRTDGAVLRDGQGGWWRLPGVTMTSHDEDEGDDVQPIKAGGPWLGIQFGPVPEAMAGHLKADGGLIVLNVAEDSPADKAGMQQHDVLIAIDGRPIKDGDVMHFMERLKEYKPGKNVDMLVLRDGNEKVLGVRLGTRPRDVGTVKYRYGVAADMGGSRVESITPRFYEYRDGKLSQPDGEAAKRFKQLLPRLSDKEGNMLLELPGNGGMSVVIRQDQDGGSLQIRREMDGTFSVTRKKPDGSSTKETFENAKAFKKSDADAHKFFHGFAGDGDTGAWLGRGNTGNFTFRMDGLDEQTKDAMKQLEKLEGLGGQFAWRRAAGGYSFHKNADGSIRVTNRSGGDELTEEFRDEQAMKKERPDLHKRYTKLNGHNHHDND